MTMRDEHPLTRATGALYEAIAERVLAQIRDGTFAPGEKLPSVREIAATFEVSVNTAVQSYRHLERLEVVDVRPRQGYFVRVLAEDDEPSDEHSRAPVRISLSEHVLRLMEPHARKDMVRLGIALPAPRPGALRRFNRVLTDTARRLPMESWDYMHPDGHLPLRRQLAKRTLGFENPAGVDDTLITSGCMEALWLSLRAVSRPGDVIAVESPTYYGVLLMLGTNDRKVLEIATREDTGIDLDVLEQAMATRRIKACVVSGNAQNPLGFTMPDASKRRLAELAGRYDVPVIENDVWGGTVFDAAQRMPVKAFDAHGAVLYCSSCSKVLVPGGRVGWAMPGRYSRRFRELKRFSTIAAPSLMQLALASWLQRNLHEEHLDVLRRDIRRQVEDMRRLILDAFPSGTRVRRPSGGCVLWVHLPRGVDGRRLTSDAQAAGVHVFPGEVFSAQGRYRDRIRINAGNPVSPEVREAVVALGQLAGAC